MMARRNWRWIDWGSICNNMSATVFFCYKERLYKAKELFVQMYQKTKKLRFLKKIQKVEDVLEQCYSHIFLDKWNLK